MVRQRGFTLIEVLVGLAILAIVITTSLAVFVERNRRLALASETVLAYQALANEAEYERRIDFAALAARDFVSDNSVLLAPLAPFTAHVEVQNTRLDVKNVKMTITWKGGKRKAEMTVVRVNTNAGNVF